MTDEEVMVRVEMMYGVSYGNLSGAILHVEKVEDLATGLDFNVIVTPRSVRDAPVAPVRCVEEKCERMEVPAVPGRKFRL